MNPQPIITLVLAVLLAVVLVAFVYSQNETRKVFASIQQIEQEKTRLNGEWARLQIELSTLVSNSRIEHIAKSELGMKLPEDEQIMVIKR
ncbi:cell division protein FtsL [Marinicella gelatinilytica]|uniref:cell division protein FtsL n=1 Tax=Marinicella gelatinilytica TaxID=2996017 RepID=UPI002260A86A|nr:cell division protein FtsL [Marinicella gelatinilytica]MCX7545150.1 cell division protein FtsL [Marinicella gelatinilytica]